MAFDVGINFRSSSGYVTDPAGTTYCIGDNYPTTRGGITFGWVDAVGGNTRDRSTSVDPRLAGINYITDVTGAKRRFRIDLPSAGATDIYCALGDQGGSNNSYLEVFDNTTSLGVLVTDQAAFPNFVDATNVARSAASWPAANLKATKTFTGTIAIFAVSPGLTSAAKNYVVAHLRVAQGGGGGTAYTLTATSTAFNLTPYPTTLRATRKLLPVSASYNVSGVNVAFRATRKLQAAPQSFSLTAVPANLARGYVFNAVTCTYTNTAYAAMLRATRRLVCGTGAFHLTPRDALMVYSAAPIGPSHNGFYPWLRRRRR